ncbi:uncharacterized protein K452DRAFT_352414 [Aplosporella prunicola CBS 121167]|uniref:40S ribosomal protein S12 n=1 Tax=Aplosporella prunicola CBS 121167 TaxID=1176127 RepID=A0A6A6B661_9PEZI|nr:uncharacterized protein K452DRAFT_352414 [Aplosporella prunicola CBS 121167]KAF2139599.1 hypothetical protein K452DRAFT_352414 [Aplosporella prunicola CBS 121167]
MRSMAMVSHTQAVPTITPPSSSHGDRSSWDYAVPLNHENAFYDPKAYMSHDVSKAYSRQPVSYQQANGVPRHAQRRNDTMDSFRSNKSAHATDAYLMPRKGDSLGRKQSSQSEADSLLELYKQNSRQASPNIRNEPWEYEQPQETEEVERQDGYWIHRDKLAQIERTELEEAGFLPRANSSESRSSSRSRVAGRKRDTSAKGDSRLHQEEKKMRMVSPIPAEDEPEDKHEPIGLPTPEEIAADREKNNARSPAPRPGTSRIPLARASPAPIPNNFVERDAPLPRSRSNSGAWSNVPGEGIVLPKPRRRGGSVGSQVLLDDVDSTRSTTGSEEERGQKKKTTTTTKKSKPPKSATSAPTSVKRPQMPAKAATTTGSRKASTMARNVSQPKPRTASTPRPRTSGNDRPKNPINRPEGEAPWLATMFKPDPRLPPEKQLVPTHAKRIAQEQWVKEGNDGTIYDHEKKLLDEKAWPPNYQLQESASEEEKPQPEAQPEPQPEFQLPSQPEPQPTPQPEPQSEPEPPQSRQEPHPEPELKREKSKRSIRSFKRAKPEGMPQSRRSESNEHGGYKTMPSVNKPVAPTPPIVPSSTTTISGPRTPKPDSSRKPDTIRVQDPDEKEDSDGEEPTSPVEQQEVEVSADASSGQMSVLDALKGVLKLALIHDGLARGLREASKALDRRQAHMCVLNEACEEEAYKKLVVALCSEHKIPLIKVPDGKQLGEWAGLCQIDREGNARKVVNCSCVVVKDWGEESQERSILLNYFQTEQ